MGTGKTVGVTAGLAFTRTFRGVTERHIIDATLIRSSEARCVNEKARRLQRPYARHGTLVLKDREHAVTGQVSILRLVVLLPAPEK